jgi:hypothetical protein
LCPHAPSNPNFDVEADFENCESSSLSYSEIFYLPSVTALSTLGIMSDGLDSRSLVVGCFLKLGSCLIYFIESLIDDY